jgi:disulfide bond formation protein DsbB
MAESAGTAQVPPQGSPDASETSDKSSTLPIDVWRSILVTQLGECWNDVRNIDSLVWQIPASIGAILGLILTGLGSKALKGHPSLLDVAAMFAVVFVSYSLLLALHKNRVFQIARNIYMKAIYRELLKTGSVAPNSPVPASLEAKDHPIDELPGFVPHATRDIVLESRHGIVHSLTGITRFNRLNTRVDKMSAYITMFRISACVLLGEFALAVWLLLRFLRLS